MLPIITEEMSTEIFTEAFQDVQAWRKNMVQYMKEENPEINSAIATAASLPDAIQIALISSSTVISLPASKKT